MGQLDDNRTDIVNAIDSLNRLARLGPRAAGQHRRRARSSCRARWSRIDGQREDLVKMLGALNHLGDVGVRVIKASKDSTIEAVRQLQPVLTELANSGDAFVDSFNVFLTFPFVDEVVGRDPQVARNLHMGDFTNLSITLELDLTKPLLPGLPCTALSNLPGGLSLDDLLDLPNLCAGVSDALTLCVNNPSTRNCVGIPAADPQPALPEPQPAAALQPRWPARWTGRQQQQQRRRTRRPGPAGPRPRRRAGRARPRRPARQSGLRRRRLGAGAQRYGAVPRWSS